MTSKAIAGGLAIFACLLIGGCGAAGAGAAAAQGPSPQAGQFADFRSAKDAPTYRAIQIDRPGLIWPYRPTRSKQVVEFIEQPEPIRLVFINGRKQAPKAATTATVTCTEDHITVNFACQYDGPAGVKWSARSRDTDVWSDNCVEVWLDPSGTGGDRYYHIAINPGGTIYDAIGKDPKAWNGKLDVVSKVAPKLWTVQLKIPFAELGLEEGKLNKLWRMNLTRLSLAPGEDTSWVVIGDYKSHVPEKFGYLWVECGDVLNVPAQDLQPRRALFNGQDLSGWRVHKGEALAKDGQITAAPGGAIVLLERPIEMDRFAISADVNVNGQFRFLFSPDAANAQTGFLAAFINHINEFNIAMMRGWEYWAPPFGHHLTIPQYSGAVMNEDTWYRQMVQFLPDRVRVYFNGRRMIEMPNLYPQARCVGMSISDGAVKNVRVQRLVDETE